MHSYTKICIYDSVAFGWAHVKFIYFFVYHKKWKDFGYLNKLYSLLQEEQINASYLIYIYITGNIQTTESLHGFE